MFIASNYCLLSVCLLQARDSYDRGDIAEGESSAWTAKMLSLAGIGVGVAILIAAAIAVVIILWN